MKMEKPKTRETNSPARPWEDRENGRVEETSRRNKRAEEIDALNRTLESIRPAQA
jgi:hypothetical protein